MNRKQLALILDGCRRRSLSSQKELYELFYQDIIRVALNYASSLEDAREIVNDVFLKVFNKIDEYDENQPFRPWLNRITVFTAIDYYRKYIRNEPSKDDLEPYYELGNANNVLEQISADDLRNMVQKLSPAYRAVLNLYAIEGYEHHEIAEILGISVGASKSNLFKARARLKMLLVSHGIITKQSSN
ncbi:MAG TPA: RNA polymerase subunit sigma-70 [Saprospirales bacterium]|nr:RNA polymerase subunit sigma-70 [Saprospirales bacterium]